MPLPDQALERLKAALYATSTTADDGDPALRTDGRAGFTATQWPFATVGSGYFQIAAADASGRQIKVTGINMRVDGTAAFNFQSPSGTYLTGSVARIMPGDGGMHVATPVPHALFIGGASAPVLLYTVGSSNMVIAGALTGFLE